MARVAKRLDQRGRKEEACGPRGRANYYTDLMDIEGTNGANDHTSNPNVFIISTGLTEPRAQGEKEAHGEEDMTYGDTSTKREMMKLEDGINSDNALCMNKGDYITLKFGRHKKQLDHASQHKLVATSPTLQAERGNPQRRAPNCYDNWRRVGRNLPILGLRGRAVRTIGLIQIASRLDVAQRTANGTISIAYCHSIVIGTSFVTISQRGMGQRPKTPLRRDTERPLAAWLRRLRGARPKLAKARASIITNLTTMPMKEVVGIIRNWMTVIMSKNMVVYVTLSAEETIASHVCGSW